MTTLVSVEPDVATIRSQSTAGPSIDDLLAGLPHRFAPVPRPRNYKLRLACCVVVLAALLLVYFTLVAVTSYGLWSHFASPSVVAAAHRLVPFVPLYAFGCVAGPVLCVFLVKPLFTLRAARPPSIRLERSAEPDLFAFVDRLCAAQGAPRPREIRLDTQVNASASLRHGWLGLFRDDLSLTIGLPLVRGLSLQELAGILAHEFGHFAQGGAMRLSSLVRRSVFLMMRIAYERDGFDAALIHAGQIRLFFEPRLLIGSLLFSAFIWAVLGLLWLARGLLKGLAWVGMASATSLSREMEHDADRHEVQAVGRAAYVRVGNRLLLLGAAENLAQQMIEHLWVTRRLPEDLPALIARQAEQIEDQPEVVRDLYATALQTTTQRFDTHPSLSDRIAAIQAHPDAGILRLDGPASALFRDLPARSLEATLAVYRHQVSDMELKTARLLPVADVMYEMYGDADVSRRLERLTQGCPIDACRGLFGASPDAPDDAEPPDGEAATRELDRRRQRVRELAPAAIEAAARLAEARERHERARLVLTLLNVGFPIDPGPIRPGQPPRLAAAQASERAAADIRSAEADLAPFAAAVVHRLRAALRLRTAVASVTLPLDSGACGAMFAALEGLAAARGAIEGLRSRLTLLSGIVEEARRNNGNPLAKGPYFEAGDQVREAMRALLLAVREIVCPFPLRPACGSEGRPDRSTLHHFLGGFPTGQDPQMFCDQAISWVNQLMQLECKLLAALAEAAEQVEQALGLPPLPDPPAVDAPCPAD